MKILFMGSPEIAVPALKALMESEDKVIGVVTQPDKPAGRGREIHSPAVASLATKEGLLLLQPETIRNNANFLDELKKLAPDLIVVCAYGKILPREILGLPPKKCINLHFSLLPKYRGAAPVQWALINDESETGVTTLYVTEKVDAGPVLRQKKVVIEPEDNTEILGKRLAVAGAQLLVETIEALKNEDLEPMPQNDRQATDAKPLKKEDGRLDWSRKAKVLLCQIRGMNPWPGAFTTLDKRVFKIYGAEVGPGKKTDATPGTVVGTGPEGIDVVCGIGVLRLREVQLEGGKKMETGEFLRGHKIAVGIRLGEGKRG